MRLSDIVVNVFLFSITVPLFAQSQPIPNISESTEFSGVIHSPSSEKTPPVFRSVFQLEIVVKVGENEPAMIYPDGVVVSEDGLIASVYGEPSADLSNTSVESVDLLTLDGSAISAETVQVDSAHGLLLARSSDTTLSALELSKRSLVAKRQLNWHAVFREGQKTILYSRPLQIHRASFDVEDQSGFCQVIDAGTSSLTAARSGSALLSLDGRLVALMGRQKHWNVSPKNSRPRTKTAYAVPAQMISKLIEQSKTE